MDGVMPSQKADCRLLRSGLKLGNFSSPEESSLIKEAQGSGRIVRASSLDSQQFETVTRLRKRVSRDQGNRENDGALKEPDGTGNRRTRFRHDGSSTESHDDRKRKETEIICRRLTRGMDGERSVALTKLTNEWAPGIESGAQSKRHGVLHEKSARRERRNVICNRAGTQIDGSSTAYTGLRKGLANDRVTRLKMAKRTLAGTEGSFDNLQDGMDRNVENTVDCPNKSAVKKRKMGQVRIVNFTPPSSSSGSFIEGKQGEMSVGRELVEQLREEPFESAKDSSKDFLLRINESSQNREGPDCDDGHVEGRMNAEKAPQLKSEMGSEKDPWINHFETAVISDISSKESKKVAVDASNVLSNHPGCNSRKRKRAAKLSLADTIQGEVVGGPVTRGKLSRDSIAFAIEVPAKVRESVGKAMTAQLATAGLGDSTVSSLNGSASVDLTQIVAGCDNVPCTVTNDLGCRVEKKQDKLQQGALMLRRSSRKRTENSPVDTESEFKQESLHQETKVLKGLGVGRLKACVLPKEESISGRSEDNRASGLDKGTEALKERAEIGEPAHEQKDDVYKCKDANLGGEHLLNFSENGAKLNDIGSAPELAQDGMGLNDVAYKIDTRGKCFLVATNPTETGGRQMRPRPLDLEQPLLVLVEGQDQDYYDLDGGSFNRMLQQQLEIKKPSSNQMNKGALQALEKHDGKSKPIVIPSFRSLPEYEEERQRFRSTYAIPESYIRVFTGTINEYNSQAEYDMDEEDEDWLYSFNQTMCSFGVSSVLSEDQFENLMDILENKAANLENLKSFPIVLDQDQVVQGTMLQASEECCICNGGENSANNLVFECADCGILVHQSCYGVQESEINVKDNKWYCRKCEAVAAGKAGFEVRCALCFKQGGALKPATEPFKWVHVVCALYTNETFFVNADAMEPINGLVAADARARKQRRRCWLCGFKEGSAERCSVKTCEAVFHVSCGVTKGASFELQHSNQQVVRVRSFCPKHANVAPVSSNLKHEGFGSPSEDKKTSKSTGVEERFLPIAEELRKHDLFSKQRHQKELVREVKTPRKDCSVQEKIDSTKSKSVSMGDDCKCISIRHRMVAPDCAKQRYFDGKAKEPSTVSEACIELDGQEEGKLREKVMGKENEDLDSVLSLKAALEIDVAVPEVVEGVYWHWASKRAKCGGALLHRIQQERAAKNFGIFNSNATNDNFPSPLFQGNAMRSEMKFEIKQTMVSARQQLQKLKELTNLIVRRERIKLDIYSIDLDITQFILEDLRATATVHTCLWCKGMGIVLHCTVCNRGFCVQCFKSKKKEDGNRGWLAALKVLKFLCFGCEKEKHQEENVSVSRISYPVEENATNCKSCQDVQHQDPGKDLPSLVNMTFEQQEQKVLLHEFHDIEGCCLAGCNANCPVRKDDLFHGDHEKVVDVAVVSTKCAPKKPNILFPPSNSNDLDKSASEAFWESVEQQSHCKKTVLVSELLKNMSSKSHEDVADAAKNYSKISFRRKR